MIKWEKVWDFIVEVFMMVITIIAMFAGALFIAVLESAGRKK